MRHTEFYGIGHIDGRVEERKFILDLLQKAVTAQMEDGNDNVSVTINYALDRCYQNLIEDLQSHKIEN